MLMNDTFSGAAKWAKRMAQKASIFQLKSNKKITKMIEFRGFELKRRREGKWISRPLLLFGYAVRVVCVVATCKICSDLLSKPIFRSVL